MQTSPRIIRVSEASVSISPAWRAGYAAVIKTYRGKVPQTLLSLTSAGRKAFEQYRRKRKEAL
jgi:hypothetical protein